jgi:hypothetical protein
VDTALKDQIPTFEKGDKAAQEVGLSNWSALTSGPGVRTWLEVAAIALVAVAIIGGAELLLRLLEVPQYILPTPSLILMGLISDFRFIAPHTLITLKELLVGFAAGASVGFVLAAVITQFPFVEKIITPYIILLVTTPMLALVPLLILRFGFGSEPRYIAIALAVGPMVMINSATGFRRKHPADFPEDSHPDGDADDYRRSDGRLDLRTADRRGRRDGRRRGGAGQPAGLLLFSYSHAAILRGHPDIGLDRHLDLRAVLLDRQEVGELGIVNDAPGQ